ncbi:MAG TPA: hypothetical protein VM031_01965 [Phycisphaerae bacterium]|nr:hypothetical protein [Phycisphaerae bacterium]
MIRRSMRKAVVTLVGSLIALAGTLAAAPSAKPKGAPPLEPSLPSWALLATLVALVGICVVAFKNAKRSHLD